MKIEREAAAGIEDYIDTLQPEELKRKKDLLQKIKSHVDYYSLKALEIGRPLNKVMIVLVGQSGAGKSATINSMFSEKICTTSSSTSNTKEVTEYGKRIYLTVEPSSITRILSLVDVPGFHDVKESNDALNLATITKFRETHEDLADRSGFDFKQTRQEVFPNMVLIIMQGGDNRMVGNDSYLKKSLKMFGQCHLIDRIHNNIICVVTHAMTLPYVAELYKEKCDEAKEHIQKAVYDVLGIPNVKIVFVENMPEDYCMEKGENSDFYRLPDGQLSHYNLIQAILEHFEQHDDYLGKFLCGWYFADNCPEKIQKSEMLYSIDNLSVSEEEVNKAQKALDCLNNSMERGMEDETFPPFPFQYLGHGYCPKAELIKTDFVYSETKNTTCSILGKMYAIPKVFQVAPKEEYYYNSLSCATRHIYQRHRQQGYGLEANVRLEVCVDSRGRWVESNIAANNRSVVSFIFGTTQAFVRVDELEKNMSKELADAIAKLPTEFSEQTANSFYEFFNIWGTHFVCEVRMGGSVKVDYSLKASTFSDEVSDKLLNQVKSTLSGIPINNHDNLSKTSLEKEDIQEEQLTISGGKDPLATSLKELAPKMKTWLESVKEMPTEERYSFKLSPYYDLIDGQGRTCLRDATLAYLGRTVTKNASITRKYSASKVSEVVEKFSSSPSANQKVNGKCKTSKQSAALAQQDNTRTETIPTAKGNFVSEVAEETVPNICVSPPINGNDDGKSKTSLTNSARAHQGNTTTEKITSSMEHLASEIAEKAITTNCIPSSSVKNEELSKQTVSKLADEQCKNCCFPPSATVYTKEGVVAFKDLKPGSKVLTVNFTSTVGLGFKTCSCSFTEMYAYIHYDLEMAANYFVFHLENGHILTVTGEHLVFTCSNGNVESVRAKQLKTGDTLATISEPKYSTQNLKPLRIVGISKATIKGVYSPLTFDGKLLVNGNLVSCYANIDSHAVAHAIVAPLTWWYLTRKAIRTMFYYFHANLQLSVTTSSSSLSVSEFKNHSFGIHEYAKFLMLVRDLLSFKILQDEVSKH